MPSRVFSEHEAALFPADIFRQHDLVRGPLFYEAILMDSGLVGEGIFPHHGLVDLYLKTGELSYQLACRHELTAIDTCLGQSERLAPGFQGHHDLLKRGVARSLSQAIYVSSTCLAPPLIAASVLAVASPRSSWQWALKTISSAPSTFSRMYRNISACSSGTE